MVLVLKHTHRKMTLTALSSRENGVHLRFVIQLFWGSFSGVLNFELVGSWLIDQLEQMKEKRRALAVTMKTRKKR